MTDQYIDVVLDGAPDHNSGKFVEVENEQGQSIRTGEWVRDDPFWRLRIKVKPGLNALAAMINKTSSEHGFWPAEGRNMGEMLMLAVSELAEALEEHREGNPVHYHTLVVRPDMKMTREVAMVLRKMRDNVEAQALNSDAVLQEVSAEEHDLLVNAGIAKPEGLAVELADCIIRCLDTMQSLGIDIEEVVREKMRFNEARPHKHGKEY